jgi:tRNA nucleotidyltransferase (CCA-adding enzyme)
LEDKFKIFKKMMKTKDDKTIYKLAADEVEGEKQQIERDKKNCQLEIEHLKSLLPKPGILEDKSDANIFVTLDKSSDRDKYDLIHKHIKCISICDVPDQTHTT